MLDMETKIGARAERLGSILFSELGTCNANCDRLSPADSGTSLDMVRKTDHGLF